MLTEFDHAVIQYANSRGEESAAVYRRIEKFTGGRYREVIGEKILMSFLDKLKDEETTRYELPYGIRVYVNGKSASIVSDLKVGSYNFKDGILPVEYDAAVDAIESLVMAHAAAGVDIGSDGYVEGLKNTIKALQNNLTE